MKVIYINYIDMNNISSGSSVRPYNIYQAFLDLGYEVELVTGLTNYGNKEERKAYLKDKLDIIKKNKYDYCYIENMSGSLFKFYNKYEYNFIKEIKKLDIPIGVFYRDIYWKFAKLFNLHGMRNFIMRYCQKKDLKFWNKICKMIFLPSESMNKYVLAKRYCALPPACANINIKEENNIYKTVVYVGGVSKNYGFYELIDALRLVNKTQFVKLNLVCRENEFNTASNYLNSLDYKWLNIKHVSGKDLEEIYKESDIAIMPQQKSEYLDFSMPVKLFEYIAYKKPIICTNCNEIAKVVGENEIGIVTDGSVQGLANAIITLYDNSQMFTQCKNNLLKYLECNHWVDRINVITRELIK